MNPKNTKQGVINTIIVAVVAVVIVGIVGYVALRAPEEPEVKPAGTTLEKTGAVNEIAETIDPMTTKTINQSIQPSKLEMSVYQSSLGFSIDYPETWTVLSNIGEYDSIIEAEKVSWNHFSIYSPGVGEENSSEPPLPRSSDLKIEVSIGTNIYSSLDEWIDSLKLKNVQSVENMYINGLLAKKVLYEGDFGGFPSLTIFYIDGDRVAIFKSYPSDTIYSQEFDTIVKTFKFTN